MSRKPFTPTDEQRRSVKAMAGYGVPHDDIARIVKCDPKTLRLRFRDELDVGSAEANSLVGQSLFKMATGGNVAAAIFWMKARAGWRETQVNEHTGPGGTPLAVPGLVVQFVDPPKRDTGQPPE